jgi:type II secretory pathway predicted ATPase ExeA
MFERYFGFTRTPFARDLKPRDLFDWSGAKEMRSRLNYVAERKLFGVFTGNVGAGKTTIVVNGQVKMGLNGHGKSPQMAIELKK